MEFEARCERSGHLTFGRSILKDSPEKTDALLESGKEHYLPNYAPAPMVLDHGKGARLWDTQGKEYVDLGAGISVTALGHGDEELVGILAEQGARLWHVSNLYFSEPAIRLAEELCAATFAERVFFCNSGAEANEAAGFHGRTLATVTATAQPKYHQGFEPLPGGFRYADYNDMDALEAEIGDRTCAVLVEPIQGEGGVVPAAPGFLAQIARCCRRHQALLIFDEVQSGLGRSGRFFAHQWEEGVVPDVVTIAKSMAGGLPMGAMLVGPEAADTLQPGSHGSTFGGNPVAAAVARAVLRRVRSKELIANVERQGERLRARLLALHNESGMIEEVRGKGLMLGAVLRKEWAGRAGELVDHCRRHGVLVLQAGPDVLRFLPPLNILDEELDEGMDRVAAALAEAAAEAAADTPADSAAVR
ncbi:MAG: aminotransferase class III-fold pyridoxal phosphate-dependent enzyme [Betaproteobacteria bacterium AqS2]|uniref:Acetylornithine aminotransferase n=1 Tax=Candidatus Amphirhobacter heronislandensis TaxID=1732024 RepID=A0A930UGI9_9GAMM|nr:aminotransferase class III-fold pyridoxal phosphate-dependent enzyme [Betaproteobacteria bacterium AqS2]